MKPESENRIDQDAELICKNCKHFRQHYIKRGRSYAKLTYGHCVYPRLKKREGYTIACEHFKIRQNLEQNNTTSH